MEIHLSACDYIENKCCGNCHYDANEYSPDYPLSEKEVMFKGVKCIFTYCCLVEIGQLSESLILSAIRDYEKDYDEFILKQEQGKHDK